MYDFYGELLTEHQRKVYEDAVYNDLSLAEIAQEYSISKQGVHDLLKRCTKTLESYEDKLHMIERTDRIRGALQVLADTADLENTDIDSLKSCIKDTVRIITEELS